MSPFHTLMGALFDPFLFVLRLIANMSSPIYEQYRCGPSRPLSAGSRSLWKPNKVHKEAPEVKPLEVPEDLRIPTLQPDPLDPLATMMSFKLMAMDVVTQMQSALHKCVNAQSPPGAKMAGIELDALRRCVPSSCYFFIDLHPHHGFKDTAEECPTSQVSSDRNNNAGSSAASTAKSSLHRQRSISECSEDSFICFEDDAEEEDEDVEEDDDEDDDDDDSSSVQFTACGEDENTEELKDCQCSDDSSTPVKKVRFNMKPEVHVMLAWDYAYRAARKSEWQVMARDRDRFQQRIRRISPILNAVLTPVHRERVYRARFLHED
ncbi:protein phosphatase 1 regulatory subunit 15A [Drosophila santomea]|uniref:protein phosphatase 1 regulatory subunit 15A n=1 Tax=Drosophila santomea TaxID=129105 RepID=UPI001953D8AC|nr:protein phosphatase 1 regulatory subunit 15A [Drosophila santomea]